MAHELLYDRALVPVGLQGIYRMLSCRLANAAPATQLSGQYEQGFGLAGRGITAFARPNPLGRTAVLVIRRRHLSF